MEILPLSICAERGDKAHCIYEYMMLKNKLKYRLSFVPILVGDIYLYRDIIDGRELSYYYYYRTASSHDSLVGDTVVGALIRLENTGMVVFEGDYKLMEKYMDVYRVEPVSDIHGYYHGHQVYSGIGELMDRAYRELIRRRYRRAVYNLYTLLVSSRDELIIRSLFPRDIVPRNYFLFSGLSSIYYTEKYMIPEIGEYTLGYIHGFVVGDGRYAYQQPRIEVYSTDIEIIKPISVFGSKIYSHEYEGGYVHEAFIYVNNPLYLSFNPLTMYYLGIRYMDYGYGFLHGIYNSDGYIDAHKKIICIALGRHAEPSDPILHYSIEVINLIAHISSALGLYYRIDRTRARDGRTIIRLCYDQPSTNRLLSTWLQSGKPIKYLD